MRHYLSLATLFLGCFLCPSFNVHGAEYETKPSGDKYYEKFHPAKAPEPGPLLLKEGDRLAIIGDSITEQKMYSRLIETYLTACTPQLKITTRQYGWSGETAEGFLHRMTNDCLRFQPTIATLCYGMNDHRYRTFDVMNAEWYRKNYSQVVENLEAAGARVVLGSPGCIGKVPPWAAASPYTADEMNINLCAFRDIDIEIAAETGSRFADVFWTMFQAAHEGQLKYGSSDKPYMLSGKDGVHPGWSGHLVMAYVFLKSMGLNGDIGTLTLDWGSKTASATAGHTIDGFSNDELTVTSTRYPFCAGGATNSDESVRSATTLVPFFQDLSRFDLVVTHVPASQCMVIWGESTNIYTAAQLAAGVNLAADFVQNPFSAAFNKVDEAVAAKQAFETKQIKDIFHGKAGQSDMAKAVEMTEAERTPLVAAIATAMVPIRYTIRILPVQ